MPKILHTLQDREPLTKRSRPRRYSIQNHFLLQGYLVYSRHIMARLIPSPLTHTQEKITPGLQHRAPDYHETPNPGAQIPHLGPKKKPETLLGALGFGVWGLGFRAPNLDKGAPNTKPAYSSVPGASIAGSETGRLPCPCGSGGGRQKYPLNRAQGLGFFKNSTDTKLFCALSSGST